MKKPLVFISLCLFCLVFIQVYAQDFTYSSWSMFGQNPQHSFGAGNAPPASNEVKWCFTGISDKYEQLRTPVIGHDGTIYLLSNILFTEQPEGNLYALNCDGSLKWYFHFIGQDPASPPTTPAIGSDRTIYFSVLNGILYAVNPDGSEKWEYDTGGRIWSIAPTIGYNGTIYIGTTDKGLFAITQEGKLKWRNRTIINVTGTPAVGKNNILYIPAITEHTQGLTAVSPEGKILWEYSPEDRHVPAGTSPVVADDGTIYFSFGRFFRALNPDGTVKWEVPLIEGLYAWGAPAIGVNHTFTLSLENPFYNSGIMHIDKDGNVLWSYYKKNVIYSSFLTTDNEGNIYIGETDYSLPSQGTNSYLTVLHADGSIKWKYQLCDKSDPVLANDGSLLLCNTDCLDISYNLRDSYLLAFAPETKTVIDSYSQLINTLSVNPNPFNLVTQITYTLHTTSYVRLSVYSINGQKIADLVNSEINAGAHSVTFNGSDYASGVYFYRFISGDYTKTGKMLLMK